VAQPRGLRLDGRFADDAAAARAALVARARGDRRRRLRPDPAALALELPRLGCINIHASLLPRWRGAAPIQRAIEAGDAETGVTLMQMDAGLDTGPILLIEATPIAADDTSATLLPRLAALGGDLAVRGLADAAAGRLQARPQPEAGVTMRPRSPRPRRRSTGVSRPK
jgi:methionyl-tRNA formyltransferase